MMCMLFLGREWVLAGIYKDESMGGLIYDVYAILGQSLNCWPHSWF